MKMKENSEATILYRGTGRKPVRFSCVGVCFGFDENKDASKISPLGPNEIIVDFYEDSRNPPQRLLDRDFKNCTIRRFMVKIPAIKGQRRSDDIPITKFAFSALVTGWKTMPTVDGRRAIRLFLTIVASIDIRQARHRRRAGKQVSIPLAAA